MPRTSIGLIEARNVQQLLFEGRGIDFQSVADQGLTKRFSGVAYRITQIVAVRRSGGASVVCAGGIYTAAARSGNALVSAAQSWIGLSGAGKLVDAVLTALTGTDIQTANPIYLSLTTGSTAAVTADVFIYGVILD